MGEKELLEYLRNELNFIIGDQILGCFYHANGKFEIGVKSEMVKRRIVEKIASGRINSDGLKHSEVLETEDFVPSSTLIYLHRVPHNFPKDDLINCIENIFNTKVIFCRTKYHIDYPGVTNGVRVFSIDTAAMFKVKDTVPDGVTINGNRFYLTFKGMVKKCFRCGIAGHVKKDCKGNVIERPESDKPLPNPTGGPVDRTQESARNEGDSVDETQESAKNEERGSEGEEVDEAAEKSGEAESNFELLLDLFAGGGEEPTLPTVENLGMHTTALKTGENDTRSKPIIPPTQTSSTLAQTNPNHATSKDSTHSQQDPPLPSKKKSYETAIQSFERTDQHPSSSLFATDVSTMVNEVRKSLLSPKSNQLDPKEFPDIQQADKEVSFQNTNLVKKNKKEDTIETCLNTTNEDQSPPLDPTKVKPSLLQTLGPRTWSDPSTPKPSLNPVTTPATNPKRPRASPSPTNSQPHSRPRMTPCVVESELENTEKWERLQTLKPTRPQKIDVPKALTCVSCKGSLVVRKNAHQLVYTYCKTDDVMIIPCSTPNCKGWLPPTLRDGARRTCRSCNHIYYRCGCRHLHVVPATDVQYKCEECAEQVCHYPCRE